MAIVIVVTLLLGTFTSALAQTEIGVVEFPEGSVQHVVHADEIDWKPCPPNLPSGCQVALLEGSPKAPGLFTIRFIVDGTFYMPPHSHPRDERVTILQGTAYVAFGEDGTRETASAFGPGDYYINKREAIHQVWADSATIFQLTGIGPWEVHFVED